MLFFVDFIEDAVVEAAFTNVADAVAERDPEHGDGDNAVLLLSSRLDVVFRADFMGVVDDEEADDV